MATLSQRLLRAFAALLFLLGAPPVTAQPPEQTQSKVGIAAPGDEYWDNRFNVLGVSGYVHALAVSGNDVYVGGQFGAVGSLITTNIAKWNSVTGAWSALGSGVSGPVYAIAVSGSEVYVGGRFAAAGGVANTQNIAKWNGADWSALGGGVNDTVEAIAISAGGIYIGGQFISASGVANTQHVAKWNGTSWSALGSGVSGPVQAIAASGTDIYVGGLFAAAGGVANTQNVGKWNGANWSALGSGVSGPVQAIAVSGADVYVGGQFAAAGGVANTQNVGKWSGTSWSALGSGVSGQVQAIAVSGAEVYVGGEFAAAGGVANTQNIGKWNSTSWTALGSGVTGPVYAIGIGVDGIYVGGLFAQTGNKAAQNFGLWHGSVVLPTNPDDVYWDGRFEQLGFALGDRVSVVVAEGQDVFVGGSFSSVAGVTGTENLARWDSNLGSWASVGGGRPGNIVDLAVSGSSLYALSCAILFPQQYLDRWDGSNWSNIVTMGGCTDQYERIMAIAAEGNVLYAGGLFNYIGFTPAKNIAKFDGTTWTPLVGGVTNTYPAPTRVDVITEEGDRVYVGGQFTTGLNASFPTSVAAQNIAIWDGASWAAMGSGLNHGYPSTGGVSDIVAQGSEVFAAGNFSRSGAVTGLNDVARWNGSTWSPLGTGEFPGGAFALALNGDDLYVGGVFDSIGGLPNARGIARWKRSASAWSALGSGLDGNLGGDANDLAIGPEGVYVAGGFGLAGNKPSINFGIWHTAPVQLVSGRISGRIFDPNSLPVVGARVQVCQTGHGGCFWRGLTDSQGNYLATGLPDGQYRVTANPPASSNLLPGSIGPVTIANGASLFGQNIILQASQSPPAGTSISPIEGTQGGLPSLHWKKTLALVTTGCPGGAASYQILQNGEVLRTGSMTESPPPPGRYVGTIEPLHPHNGYATIRMTIQCPDNSTQTIDFSIYIDPSGIVRTIHGSPIEGATVTLSYFDDGAGVFALVPAGDAIMSPANRTNPDTTNSEGHFGWDVVAGYYKVRAEKTGCHAPFNPQQTYVETEILVIPPPVTDLDLRLDCGLNNAHIYLPLVQR